MIFLADDVCRCRDDDCPERTDCERYLQRNDGGLRTVSADSLYPHQSGILGLDQCPYRIPSYLCEAIEAQS